MIWADIKHLNLQDDDVIHSGWVEGENFDYDGYQHNEINRIVEETDEQIENELKRQSEAISRLKNVDTQII